MFERLIKSRVEEALADTPVVLVTGPRRAGKTTLTRALIQQTRPYLTLDDQTTLDAARFDPVGFIRNLDSAVIDEVQRAPDLLLAIKKSVDEDYRPGRFLLTGSANVLTLPKVADSLAGRIETIRMLPLSQAEIGAVEPTFLDLLFASGFSKVHSLIVGDELVQRVLRGGFPEAIGRDSERRRHDWLQAYLTSILTRDLRDFAEIGRLDALPKFVRILAEYSGQLANFSQLGAGIDVSHKTAQRYVGLLEQVFLLHTLQPWHSNALKRLVKTPKLHLLDSGLLASIRSLTSDKIQRDRVPFGSLLETFIFAETLKLMTASDMRLTPYHYRDQQMHEVDIVLERDDGMVAGIEIKAGATVRGNDFAGLRTLKEACDDRFAQGVVLYDGADTIPFGDKMTAVPISALWN